nr:hypothetical protein [Streptomyces sp. ODS25]
MRLPRPRLPRRFRFHWSMLAVFPAAAAVALTLIVVDPYGAGHPSDGEETHTARRARVPHGQPTRFGADCRTRTQGSQAVAYCHNPYPEPDRVRLHIECARWWDIDSDGPPVEAGPAMTVRLTGRCWKEIGSVWVSHQP